ncbi:hypothetical protein GCM10011512_24800 [Tersicoccus solisilvae]|uniref:Uncharacterized protein n=1 Tax=Tersicoccus solisilvae TaxID=1882339 RepID=A0ABQ1PGF4_9MICC|nr:hypothetical protein [Tersicoccus solisilvae]GGC96812.1 hypothetical protein GCM10011512_24800 [Tersicoccus solisilvae]
MSIHPATAADVPRPRTAAASISRRLRVLGPAQRLAGGSAVVSRDLLGLSSDDLRTILNRICHQLDRGPREAASDVDVLTLRRHAIVAELSLRELSVAPGRPAIWAV